MISEITQKVRVFASQKNWIESSAVSQLAGTANLPEMELAVGLPDLHPGKNGPVGAAFVSSELIYPHLIGNDVGCGMGLWLSDLPRKKVKLDRWEHKLTGLDHAWEGDRQNWLEQFAVAAPENFGVSGHEALGTIGGGNHFAELQQIEAVADREAFAALGLDEERLVVLVHSGSRGLGKDVLFYHHRLHGYGGLPSNSDEAQQYMGRHDYAVKWAMANRALIAWRFLNALGSEAHGVLDLPHNFLAHESLSGNERWIHRKGANPSVGRVSGAPVHALVIPGSRGTLSYLVAPVGDQDANARSLSHGAGRKWARSDCRARLRERYDDAALLRTEVGSRVICEDRELLYEEAPQAYKNVEVVVQDLLDAGLIRVVATLRPLITYKVRRDGA